VYIVERKHSRAASGNIKLMADNSQETALFAPTDHRVPRFIIPMSDCPQGIHIAQIEFVSSSVSKDFVSIFFQFKR